MKENKKKEVHYKKLHEKVNQELNKKDSILFFLAALFITNAILAEIIGGKLISFFGIFTQSIGIILWPFVFLLTDLLNEFYGKKIVTRLSYITVFCIIFAYLILFFANSISAVPYSPINNEQFESVFIQSQWIIIGSIIAFIVSQIIDVHLFLFFKKITGNKLIWLRSTGSTLISQLVDTFIVQFVAFVLPGIWSWNQYIENASIGYIFKIILAIFLTPLIYLGHFILSSFLKRKEPL